MSEEILEQPTAPPETERQETQDPAGKLVHVTEAIKYRRRAQQAEQQLKEVQAQFEARMEQLATAEAQRDELQHQVEAARRRGSAERLLLASGASDMDAAMILLEKRLEFAEEIEPDALRQAVEGLLVDKPFLLSPAPLPGKTASPRPVRGPVARLAQAASRAAHSGNRHDVAEYLRLRRQTAR